MRQKVVHRTDAGAGTHLAVHSQPHGQAGQGHAGQHAHHVGVAVQHVVTHKTYAQPSTYGLPIGNQIVGAQREMRWRNGASHGGKAFDDFIVLVVPNQAVLQQIGERQRLPCCAR